MKPSSTLVFAGIALLFLAMFYSIAPSLLYAFSLGFARTYTHTSIFAWNYYICEILGIIFLLSGFWKLWNEK